MDNLTLQQQQQLLQQQHQQQQHLQQQEVNSPDGDGSGDDVPGASSAKPEKKAGRRKINIEFIEDKSRRHITFSKRKAGIMKKAYELSTLTGTQVLLLVASETGHVYTFATPKLQPLITKTEGKNLIQKCLNAPDDSAPQQQNYQQSGNYEDEDVKDNIASKRIKLDIKGPNNSRRGKNSNQNNNVNTSISVNSNTNPNDTDDGDSNPTPPNMHASMLPINMNPNMQGGGGGPQGGPMHFQGPDLQHYLQQQHPQGMSASMSDMLNNYGNPNMNRFMAQQQQQPQHDSSSGMPHHMQFQPQYGNPVGKHQQGGMNSAMQNLQYMGQGQGQQGQQGNQGLPPHMYQQLQNKQ